jgi:colanic acid biosynthesis protein WcaH
MSVPPDDFANILRSSPLISIDLVVRDEIGRTLVGLRRNRPAQGSWFVPGGRIFKDERIDDAFLRISQDELGRKIPRGDARFLGVYEHMYADNALEIPDVSTHYVVLGYQLRIAADSLVLPPGQHERFRWMDVNEIHEDAAVHPNTKAFLPRDPEGKSPGVVGFLA